MKTKIVVRFPGKNFINILWVKGLSSETVSIRKYHDIRIDVHIDIKTVYLYIQYFMTDAVVVYYGCQFYSSVTTYLRSAYNFGKSSLTNSHFNVSYNISLYRDTKHDTPKLCIITPLV